MNIIEELKSLIAAPGNLISWHLNIPLLPRWIVFMPSDACNSKCRHCDIWQQKPTPNPLTPEEIEKTFKDPLFKNVEMVMLTGGEVTMRKDLPEVISAIHRALPKAAMQISTNALLPERILETTRTAIKEGIDFEVGISLDGIGKDHDDIRGVPGNFEKADYLIKELVILRKENPEILKIAAGIVLSDLTLGWLDKVRDYTKERNIMLVEAWYNESSFYKNIGKNEIQVKLRKAVKSQPTSLLQEKWLDLLKGKSIQFPCFAVSSYCVLKCNGDIVPCLNLWNDKVGNTREATPTEIWHSEKAKKIREKVKNCKGCLNGWGAGWSFKSSYYQILFFYLRHPKLLIKKIRGI